VLIYSNADNADVSQWKLEHTLKGHDLVISAIDWSPVHNKIVTCSHDRNAFVWSFKNGEWKPSLSILRINRAATHVKWSPNEEKFAVASGAKAVSVCYFEEDNDWWVSKHIKKHRSTVLRVDWHPSSALLATASSDFKCRIVCAYIKAVDKTPVKTVFGDKLTFGEVFAELECSGWVTSCKWSASGNRLAYVGHDSTLSVAEVTSATPSISSLSFPNLPLRDLIFINEDNIIAVGHDTSPIHFQASGGKWKLVKLVDTGGNASTSAAAKGPAAMSKFQSAVDRGGAEAIGTTSLSTKHQNCISCVQSYKGASQYSTSGLDGNIAIWDFK